MIEVFWHAADQYGTAATCGLIVSSFEINPQLSKLALVHFLRFFRTKIGAWGSLKVNDFREVIHKFYFGVACCIT